MNLSSYIRNFFPHLYLAISIEDNLCTISYETYKNDQKIASEHKEFTINDKETMDPYIVRYIQNLQTKYRHNYVSLISNASKQGILLRCNDNAFSHAKIQKKDVKYLCVEDKWGAFIAKEGFLNELNYFDEITLDLYYSPFNILDTYINQHSASTQTTLYILNRMDSISIIIATHKQYLYGTHFNLDNNLPGLEDVEEEEIADVLEDNEEEEMFALDEFSFDDDLEELEDLEEISDNDISPSDEKESNEHSATDELEIFGRDLKTFSYIKSSIDEFYTQGNNDFINKIVIYDNENISTEVIDFIENDLLLEVEIKHINILDTAISFAKSEVYA